MGYIGDEFGFEFSEEELEKITTSSSIYSLSLLITNKLNETNNTGQE